MRVWVFGSRSIDAVTRYPAAAHRLAKVIAMLPPGSTVVTGACPRGADRWATVMTRARGDMIIESEPADWDRYGRSAGHRRNRVIAETRPDLGIGIWDGRSPGTAGSRDLCLIYCIPFIVYLGDGSVDESWTPRGGRYEAGVESSALEDD
jgi:hypothetical protein